MGRSSYSSSCNYKTDGIPYMGVNIQKIIRWDPLYGGEHLGRVGHMTIHSSQSRLRDLSHHYFASVLNPSMELGKYSSPSDEAYMGGFTMRKPFGPTHRRTCICQVTSRASANAAKA